MDQSAPGSPDLFATDAIPDQRQPDTWDFLDRLSSPESLGSPLPTPAQRPVATPSELSDAGSPQPTPAQRPIATPPGSDGDSPQTTPEQHPIATPTELSDDVSPQPTPWQRPVAAPIELSDDDSPQPTPWQRPVSTPPELSDADNLQATFERPVATVDGVVDPGDAPLTVPQIPATADSIPPLESIPENFISLDQFAAYCARKAASASDPVARSQAARRLRMARDRPLRLCGIVLQMGLFKRELAEPWTAEQFDRFLILISWEIRCFAMAPVGTNNAHELQASLLMAGIAVLRSHQTIPDNVYVRFSKMLEMFQDPALNIIHKLETRGLAKLLRSDIQQLERQADAQSRFTHFYGRLLVLLDQTELFLTGRVSRDFSTGELQETRVLSLDHISTAFFPEADSVRQLEPSARMAGRLAAASKAAKELFGLDTDSPILFYLGEAARIFFQIAERSGIEPQDRNEFLRLIFRARTEAIQVRQNGADSGVRAIVDFANTTLEILEAATAVAATVYP